MTTNTTQTKTKVIVTRRLPDTIETRMMELFDVELNLTDTPMSQADLIKAVQSCDVLVPTLTDEINADVLSHAGDPLKLIANYGAGIDHINLDVARSKRISVSYTPDVLTEDTADMTMALILAVSRRLVEGEKALRAGEWTGWSPTWMLGHRIHGKRLGIVGMGRIGCAVAKRAKGFGLSVHYHNRARVHEDIEKNLEATYWESLDQMLARMDIISVNCPHTPATYHLLSARRLRLMQKHAYIVNTARGEVIDEATLIDLLKSGHIGGAGLDVYENEPHFNKKFLDLKNVTLIPHMGSATVEARIDMGERVLINIKAFIDGYGSPDRVIGKI
ncbi:MAG: D-glycerate dehydrogenase [Magnetovibrio sp.]|nr:D-glycerate dehydrogenase [Magnetovibrio sp.]